MLEPFRYPAFQRSNHSLVSRFALCVSLWSHLGPLCQGLGIRTAGKPTMKTPSTQAATPQRTAEDAAGHFHNVEPAPIRAEFYGLDQLEAYARRLAEGTSVLGQASPGYPLLRRLAQNGRSLRRALRLLAAAGLRAELPADAEWLLDNSHIVEDSLRVVRHDLPRSYHRQLPKLTNG